MTRRRSSPTRGERALAWSVPLFNEAAALLRSVILARMLGPEELGKTMVLVLALRLVEMATDVSFERLMAQAPDGGRHAFQARTQGAALLRGIALSVILVTIPVPMALAFAGGPSATSYAVLAVVPLARGFLNLDYRRFERAYVYKGIAAVDAGATLAMLIAAPFCVWAIGDHRAILAVVIVHVTFQVALSHLVANRRFKLEFDTLHLRRLWTFGAPLLLNAILMFLTFQADRLIVAHQYGWEALGIYGVALQLSLLPAQIAGRAAGSLLSPKFRRAIASGTLPHAARPALRGFVLLSVAFVIGYGLLAAPVIALVYGAGFTPVPALVWGLGLAAAIRMGRTPLSQLAVSLGKTSIPARANILRALVLIVALFAAVLGAPIATLAWIAAWGEAMAAMRSWQLLSPILFQPKTGAAA